MDTNQSFERADKIPSLGGGGKQIKDYLYLAAKNLKKEYAIVEVGSFLGSATGYLCIGIKENNHRVVLHCYDLWIAVERYRLRAKKHLNIDFEENEDLLYYFKRNIDPFIFSMDLCCHKGDFKNVTNWDGGSIGLAVFDAGCDIETNNNFFKVFSYSFISGETLVILMDYYYCARKNKWYHTQRKLMDKNKHAFEHIGKIGNSYSAIFKYIGGEINYLDE